MRCVFTHTTGRSGTLYLARALAANVGSSKMHVYHEHLGPDDFFTRTPHIGVMRSFNHHGRPDDLSRQTLGQAMVEEFWHAKAEDVTRRRCAFYIETSHMLSKAGLLDYLDLWPDDTEFDIVVLRRTWREVATSLRDRFDWANLAIRWQFYLSEEYPTNLVDSAQFEYKNTNNGIVWYLAEMEARAQRYMRVLGDHPRVTFHEVWLDDIIELSGLLELVESLRLPVADTPEDIGVQNPRRVKFTWEDDEEFQSFADGWQKRSTGRAA